MQQEEHYPFVRIWKKKYHEESFISDVAISLNNITKIFMSLKQYDDALDAAKEAVGIYRNLAATRPDIFNPAFSMSLNNLAFIHGHLKHHEEAINYALEAVAIRRNLVSKHRDVFNADLATSLFILAQQYEMNNSIKAHQIIHEAVSTLQASFMQHPIVHQHLMAFIIQIYARLCEATKIEMDMDLILPLIFIFQQLQTKEQTHA